MNARTAANDPYAPRTAFTVYQTTHKTGEVQRRDVSAAGLAHFAVIVSRQVNPRMTEVHRTVAAMTIRERLASGEALNACGQRLQVIRNV